MWRTLERMIGCGDRRLGVLLRVLPLLVLVPAAARPAGAITFGAIGDSLTDEYQFEGGPIALNFVEQLVRLRGFDFGAFEGDPSVRGEPRKEGYAHNWARFGASATEPTFASVNLFSDLPRLNPMPLFSVQVNGLVPEVAGGEVDVVYVGIGINDVFIHLFLDGDFTGPGFVQFKNDLVTAILAAVDSLLAAGPPAAVILGGIPDFIAANPGAHPPISPFIEPSLYRSAIADINQDLAQAAADRGIGFVNLFDGVKARTDASGDVVVGSFRIPPDSVPRLQDILIDPDPSTPHGPCSRTGSTLFCASQTFALNFFAQDAVHPNTIIQSLMANEFIDAVNRELGLGVAPLSDTEILDLAFLPEPSGALMLGVALAALGALARRRRPRARALAVAAAGLLLATGSSAEDRTTRLPPLDLGRALPDPELARHAGGLPGTPLAAQGVSRPRPPLGGGRPGSELRLGVAATTRRPASAGPAPASGFSLRLQVDHPVTNILSPHDNTATFDSLRNRF